MDDMSSRERILNSLTGKETDRTPWSPNLAYYWENLDISIQEKGKLEYLKMIGADPLLRGSHVLFDTIFNECEITENTNERELVKVFDTKVGKLTQKYTYSESGKTWYITEHAVKSEEDFKILQFIFENIKFKKKIDTFEKDKRMIGDEGVYMPLLAVNAKTAFQSMVEIWCGTVQLTYSLYDYQNTVLECLDVMKQRNMETIDINMESSAESFIFWEDTSTTNISPSMFKDFVRPEINSWADRLHEDNRMLAHHACGHLKNVMHMISESHIDILESISPPTTGDIEIKSAREILPEHIAIIGGIEPVKLLTYSLSELEEYVIKLLNDTKGTRYILANSDSCPPGVDEKKFFMISDLVKSYK